MSTRRLEVVITGDASGLNRAVGVVQRDMGRVESTTRKLGKAISIGLGVGIVAAVPLMLKAGDAASDLAEQVNKTGAVFKSSAPEIVKWSTSTSQSLGISQRAALEAAGTFGNMLVPMGFARDRAGEMSQRMVELAADLSSFNNASPEETLDAIRAGLAGESEPLRRFGVFLNDARLKQEALSQGLYSGKGALDANAKAQATYALILKDTTDAQGDFARTSGGVANSQRIARAELENAAATTGAIFVPAMAKVLTVVNQVLLSAQRNWPRFRQATTDAFQATQRVVSQVMDYYRANIAPTIQAIVSAARGFWIRFGGDITAAFNLARRVVGNTMRGIRAVITGVLAVLRGDWSTAWNSLKTVVKSATDSVLAILRGLPGIVFGIATGIGKAIADGVMAGLASLPGRIAGAIRGGLGAADNTPSIDLGRGGLTGQRADSRRSPGAKEDARRPGQLPFFPGGNPLSPTGVADIIIGDLHRDDSLQDKRTRSGAESRARKAGFTNPDEIALRGERAVLRVRKKEIIRDMGTVRAAMRKVNGLITRRKAKRAKRYAALAAVKGQSDAAKEQRQKIQDSITSDNNAIRDRYDELNALIRRGADLEAESKELGFDIQGLDAEIAATPDLAPVDPVAPEPSDAGSSALGVAGPSADAQAQIDQANQRASAAQNETRAFGAFVKALRGSGTIDPGGGTTVVQYIEGSLVQEAQLATFITSALDRQGRPSSGTILSPA